MGITHKPHLRFNHVYSKKEEEYKKLIKISDNSFVCKEYNFRVKVCRMINCKFYPCNPKT